VGVLDEATDLACQLARLILGDERVAVGDLDQASVGQELGQSTPAFGGHDAVLARPDHERRKVEGPQPLGRGRSRLVLGVKGARA
jgi:hypothetical protein